MSPFGCFEDGWLGYWERGGWPFDWSRFWDLKMAPPSGWRLVPDPFSHRALRSLP
jgi:hypothetical protein